MYALLFHHQRSNGLCFELCHSFGEFSLEVAHFFLSREVDDTEGEDNLLLLDRLAFLLNLNVDRLLHANLKLILGRLLFDFPAAGDLRAKSALNEHFLRLSHNNKEDLLAVSLREFQADFTIRNLSLLVLRLHYFESVRVFLYRIWSIREIDSFTYIEKLGVWTWLHILCSSTLELDLCRTISIYRWRLLSLFQIVSIIILILLLSCRGWRSELKETRAGVRAAEKALTGGSRGWVTKE